MSLEKYKNFLEKAIYLTFSKEGKSVWVDITFNANFGEEIVYAIRSLLLDRFNFSCNGSLRLQSNVNVKDIWDEPDLMSILNKLAMFTVEDKGEILNLRMIFHILKDVIYPLYQKNDSKRKNFVLFSHLGLIFSCFENLVFDVSFNSQDMVHFIVDAIKAANDFGDQEFDEKVQREQEIISTNLAMGLGMIGQIKPMLADFIPGLKEIDFDKICIEGLSPEIRTEFKLNIHLPGMNEFVEKNITN